MRGTSTDFYLNLDRWEGLTTVERQQGRWEARLAGPATRVEAIRRDAVFESGWGLFLHGVTADARMQDQILGPAPPPDKHPVMVKVWRYCRAVQFVNGWYGALGWTEEGIARITHLLYDTADGVPAGGAMAGAILAQARRELLDLHQKANGTAREIGGIPLIEGAAFYGALRTASSLDEETHKILFLLGLRMLLLQMGYVQILFAPLEAIFVETRVDGLPGAAGSHTTSLAYRDQNAEEILGVWLDSLTNLLLAVGKKADEAWEEAQALSARSRLQEVILGFAHKHGRVTAGDVLRATGANRNTVKDNLARLVQEGTLRKQGRKRGTLYIPS